MYRFASGDEYAGEYDKGRRHGKIRAVRVDGGSVEISKYEGDKNTGRACNLLEMMKRVNEVVVNTELIADDCQDHVTRMFAGIVC